MPRTIEEEVNELFGDSIALTSKDSEEFKRKMQQLAGDYLQLAEEFTIEGEEARSQRSRQGHKIAKQRAEEGQ